MSDLYYDDPFPMQEVDYFPSDDDYGSRDFDETDDFPDESVPVILRDLPTRIRGFVCKGSDYNPIIILNSRMTKEQQSITYRHEMNHILRGEMDDLSYYEYGGSA